jgi:hypothetical protein
MHHKYLKQNTNSGIIFLRKRLLRSKAGESYMMRMKLAHQAMAGNGLTFEPDIPGRH